jgi:hypothetical protein
MPPAASELVSMSPEERLLVACARCTLSPDQHQELETLVGNRRGRALRWDQVWHKAQWYNLTPLVYHHLSQLENRRCIPAPTMDKFKAAYRDNTVMNLFFQAELRKVVEALDGRGVPVILLKGLALSEIVYEKSALRPMTDLDLLVPEELVACAQETVHQLGYSPIGIVEQQLDTEQNHRHLPALQRPGTPAMVEIHRHIVRRDSALYFDIRGFWERSREVSIGEVRTRILAPEDLLIHLSLNYFLDRRFHSLAALRQLCDVAESVKHYQHQIQWPALLDNAREYGVEGSVTSVLYQAKVLLGAPVPDDLLQPSQVTEDREVARFLRRRVLDTRHWVARGLAVPGKKYQPHRVAAEALHRFIPSRRHLAQRYHRPVHGIRSFLLYAEHIGVGVSTLTRAVACPQSTMEDLAIDRWLHSLYAHKSRR